MFNKWFPPKWKNNRLARLWDEFALRFELMHKMYADGSGGELIIPESRSINAKYHVHESQKSYTFGASLRGLPDEGLAEYALEILNSEPVIGLVERFIDGKFVVLGGRNGLENISDAELIRYYMDDVARITAYFKRLN